MTQSHANSPAPKRPVAIFTADTHLQERAWSERGNVDGDSYCSFLQIVDFAIAQRIPIFAAGDLIDQQINKSSPIKVLMRQLDRLEEAKVPFYFTQGQHEMQAEPWFTCHRWPQHIHKKTITLRQSGKTTTVYGLDYQPAGKLQAELEQIPAGMDILLCHQVWSDFMGSLTSPQGGMGDVPVVRTVVSGDYHVTKDVRTKGKDGQPVWLLSPGSTCMQSIDEPPEKFFYVMTEEGLMLRKRLKTRPVIASPILNRTDEFDQYLAELPQLIEAVKNDKFYPAAPAIQRPLLWLHYGHRIENVRARVLSVVGTSASVFWKEIVPEKPEVQERLRAAQHRGERRATTLLSALPTFLETHDMIELRDDCQRLLQHEGDPKDELQRMREEALK